MLSYLHGYHAGNHADVLKHTVLVACLAHLLRKETPFSVIDTHAGAGVYDLDSNEARRHREFETGISRLRGRDDAPDPVRAYVEVVDAVNGPQRLRTYPGSPRIALELLRATDPLDLFELHPSEASRLERLVGGRRRTAVRREDGFKGSIGLLPPPSRRGLVIVDPPYEVKADFAAVVKALVDGHRRFATGTWAIWYPVTTRARVDELVRRLKATRIADMHRYELCVAPDSDDFGMTGSGMIVVRPPYTLSAAMDEVLPYLVRVLGGEGAAWSRTELVPE
jgi:23S rRNA (adenine2030-N6)-methyltransferase